MVYRKLVRGVTVVEIITVLVVVAVVVAVAIPIVQMFRPPRGCGYPMRDSSQLRGIVQAMSIWAGNNKGRYPLPSAIDLDNTTVAEAGSAKDTTANILSLMVFNGSVPTEILVSPQEANPSIQQYTVYEFNSPRTARVPDKALWDPALSADFTGGKIGAISYANLHPCGPRLDKWTDSFDSNSPVLGNRGPQILSVTKRASGVVIPVLANTKSNTFLIHGGRTTWEGNIGFNDAHVDFKTGLAPGPSDLPTYKDASGVEWPDFYHYDEPDDPTGANAFLGIFTKAGPKPADFTAIWD